MFTSTNEEKNLNLVMKLRIVPTKQVATPDLVNGTSRMGRFAAR